MRTTVLVVQDWRRTARDVQRLSTLAHQKQVCQALSPIEWEILMLMGLLQNVKIYFTNEKSLGSKRDNIGCPSGFTHHHISQGVCESGGVSCRWTQFVKFTFVF